MRSKEEAHDYRYFPDPDLVPLIISQSRIEKIKKTLPELPDQLKSRLKRQYNLGTYDARVISADLQIAKYFEELSLNREPKQAANWIITNLFGKLNESNKHISESPVNSESLGKLLDLINNGTISNKVAKDVFEEMFESKKSAESIVEEKGLKQISNQDELKDIIKSILEKNPQQKKQFLEGNMKIMGWFIGQVMKETRGQANPTKVNQIIKEILEK
tara:strand:- start:124 stop:774 length:651 start_codon:yes stop_codon:yes gene_type:complete